MADIGNIGNRLIVDIEKGKPTVQLQKVLEVPDVCYGVLQACWRH